MPIELVAGTQSDNSPYWISLGPVPHLFVAYTERFRLDALYCQWITQLTPQLLAGNIRWAFAGKACKSMPGDLIAKAKAFHGQQENGERGPMTAPEFLQTLQQELRERQRFLKQNRSLLPLVVFIDEIFERVLPLRKRYATILLQVLKDGPSCRIHLVMGSWQTYRHLSRQLLELAVKPISAAEQQVVQHPAAELVITPDDLFFYRQQGSMDFLRLFAWDEGQRTHT